MCYLGWVLQALADAVLRTQLLGEEDLPKLLRLALVRMPPGARISLHADRGGFLLYRRAPFL